MVCIYVITCLVPPSSWYVLWELNILLIREFTWTDLPLPFLVAGNGSIKYNFSENL